MRTTDLSGSAHNTSLRPALPAWRVLPQDPPAHPLLPAGKVHALVWRRTSKGTPCMSRSAPPRRCRMPAPLLLRRALLPSMILGMVGTAQAQAPAPATASEASAPVAAKQLDSVQVRGVRGSATGAVEAKQAKAEISDSVVAEDIGKLPDNSVAAALQRVTGVQVARGGAEVGTVLVRGLPDVVTTFDGRNVFTASGRGIALQDIPADLLQSVDVYKTGSAKFLEGASAAASTCTCASRSTWTRTPRLPAASVPSAVTRRGTPSPTAA